MNTAVISVCVMVVLFITRETASISPELEVAASSFKTLSLNVSFSSLFSNYMVLTPRPSLFQMRGRALCHVEAGTVNAQLGSRAAVVQLRRWMNLRTKCSLAS